MFSIISRYVRASLEVNDTLIGIWIIFPQHFFKVSNPLFNCNTSLYYALFFLFLSKFTQKRRDAPLIREKGRCRVVAHLSSRHSDTSQGGTTANTWAARISTIGPNELRLSSTSALRSRERARVSRETEAGCWQWGFGARAFESP